MRDESSSRGAELLFTRRRPTRSTVHVDDAAAASINADSAGEGEVESPPPRLDLSVNARQWEGARGRLDSSVGCNVRKSENCSSGQIRRFLLK